MESGVGVTAGSRVARGRACIIIEPGVSCAQVIGKGMSFVWGGGRGGSLSLQVEMVMTAQRAQTTTSEGWSGFLTPLTASA